MKQIYKLTAALVILAVALTIGTAAYCAITISHAQNLIADGRYYAAAETLDDLRGPFTRPFLSAGTERVLDTYCPYVLGGGIVALEDIEAIEEL